MKRPWKILILTSFWLFSGLAPTWGQPYSRGAVLDPVRYDQAPRKARLVTRAYEQLPAVVSLKAYAPEPRSQGQFGTCTAWATAYAARTIAESKTLNRTNRAETNRNVFSPAFVYKNISSDPTCTTGSSIIDALDLMETVGVPKLPEFETLDEFDKIPLNRYAEAPKYRIASWATLFGYSDDKSSRDFRTQAVKKSLASGKVVVVALDCPESFDRAVGVWNPLPTDQSQDGHALCVVGYDDGKYGGAFEIQNSWGTDWGNQGYLWVRYSDFSQHLREAYELVEDLAAQAELKFEASVNVRVAGSSEPMAFTQSTDDQTYISASVYPSGTRFRVILTNGEPAYVYALGSDGTGATSILFPLEGKTPSAVLDYPASEVAYPDEAHWIQMDNTEGWDYLTVLFSKRPLDIERIRAKTSTLSGSAMERVAGAVGPTFVSADQGRYQRRTPAFRAVTGIKDAVYGLTLAIRHGKQ